MRALRPLPSLETPVWAGDWLSRNWRPDAGACGASREASPTLALPDGTRVGDHVDLPFEVKLLDVGDRLSIQVHPDTTAARALGHAHGKDEIWVVLHAAAGARVAVGLLPGVTAADVAAHTHAGTLAEVLSWRPAHVGDRIDLPAGTIHAACGPLVLYEVHTRCDLTWRLHDWGRGRPLDVPAALGLVARRLAAPPPTASLLVSRVGGGTTTVSVTWTALTCIDGTLRVGEEDVPAGTTVLLPPGAHAFSGTGEGLLASSALATGAPAV